MPNIGDNTKILASSNLTIASSGSTSDALDVQGNVLTGMIVPAMTGTTLTFSVSFDGTTYYAYYDQYGAQPSVTVISTARYIEIDEEDFVGAQFIKVVSGSTEAASRTITMIVRPL